MNFKQGRSIIKVLTESQFEYYPLIRVFHSRKINNKINNIHEKVRGITYESKSSTFQDRLQKGNSVSIHHRNIKNLDIEIYQVLNGLHLF